jgi:hypothetical protein
MAKGPFTSDAFTKRLDAIVAVRLEAGRDKPVACRYQPNELPTIVYLSPRGVILDRTEGFVAEDDLAKRIDGLAEKGKAADEVLATLEAAVQKDADDLDAKDELARFWLGHENWADAVPVLAELVKKAGEKRYPVEKRNARWIDLIRGLTVLERFDESVKEAEALAKRAGAQRKTEVVQTAEFLIGFAREHQGKKEDALRAYDRCIELGARTRVGAKAKELRDALAASK